MTDKAKATLDKRKLTNLCETCGQTAYLGEGRNKNVIHTRCSSCGIWIGEGHYEDRMFEHKCKSCWLKANGRIYDE